MLFVVGQVNDLTGTSLVSASTRFDSTSQVIDLTYYSGFGLLRTRLVHEVDQRDHVVDGGLGQDAVAEVENVAGAAGGAA